MYAHLLSSAFTYLHLSSFPTICHNLPSSSFHLASSDFISFICLYWPPPACRLHLHICSHLPTSAIICMPLPSSAFILPSSALVCLHVLFHLCPYAFICLYLCSFALNILHFLHSPQFSSPAFIFVRIPLYVFICLHVP